MSIVTANEFFGWSRVDTWEKRLPELRKGAFKMAGATLPETVAPKTLTLGAIVNAGKWLVRCENPSCGGAEKVWEEGLMFCASCLNAHVGHHFIRTAFPKNREQIEAILELRPNQENRHWEPDETVEDLVEENRDHGVEVPDGMD